MGNSEKYPDGKKHLLNIVTGNRRGLIEHKDKTSRDFINNLSENGNCDIKIRET